MKKNYQFFFEDGNGLKHIEVIATDSDEAWELFRTKHGDTAQVRLVYVGPLPDFIYME
jgi:hypothetical protein